MGFKAKIKHLKEEAINSYIYKSYYNDPIDDSIVYVESRDGRDFTGNILRIVEELSSGKYGDFKIYVYAYESVVAKIEALKKNYNLNIYKIITKEAAATKILEQAKYIFTDSGIRPKYIKKDGQIFINTWHGTPLKHMGFDNVTEQHRIANIQHTFLSSDYLLFPNDYMKEKMMNSYMVGRIYPGKILREGYPRNSVFFDEKRKDEFKSKFGLADKEVFVYMPTFKGLFLNRDYENKKDITGFFEKLDSKLKDNQVLLTKLHVHTTSKIDYSKLSHIQPFPEGFETYDILNMADILVTDYSSVFFDFANTKRKIILFNYDEEEFLSYRGMYLSLDDLPFPKVQTSEDLIRELNSPKDYDDTKFIERFCTYDRPDAVEDICKHIFKGKNVCNESVIENTKDNIVIYAGSMYNNGITSALLNFLETVDLDKYNYFISFRPWDKNILENHEEIFKKFPRGIEFLPFRFPIIPTVKEKRDLDRFMDAKGEAKLTKNLHRLFSRTYIKHYGNVNLKAVINFDGYTKRALLVLSHATVPNSIWVHSNMIQEKNTRDNQNLNVLREAYSRCDNVVVVSKYLIEPTSQISGRKDNIRVINNVNNYEKIIEKSKREITLDETTEVYPNDNAIYDVFKKPGKKFITIGRFSPEKGHERLLKAFDEFADDYPDTQLIIIGGHGVLFEKTCEIVDSLKHSQNVVLVKDISNPMPILEKCDLFIMPSFYEGWGIVIMEADTLNVPVIACDCEGVQWLNDYGGNIIENSQEGILKGMYEFINGNVSTLNIDYQDYNSKCINDLYLLLNN